MPGILEGIRVLDFGRFISCPYCGMLLADLGAEVIKIERAHKGEDGRRLGPFKNGVSMYVTCFNRNKKGLAVDFRSDAGKEILRGLVRQSDVIIENFRPGTMAKMGLSYEECKELNPRIIMASISGFGQYGEYTDKAAFDGIATAMSGLMGANFGIDGPRPFGAPISDHVTGIYTAFQVVLALYDRMNTGEGQYIDTAMMDCMFPMLETQIPNYGINGVNTMVKPRNGDPLTCPSNIYRCKDGYVDLHAGTDPNYIRFAQITQDPVLMSEKYMKIEARMQDYQIVDGLTAKWFSTVTVDEAEALLREAGVPLGIVADIGRIFRDPNSKRRNQIIHVDVPGIGPVPVAGNPIKLKTRPIERYERAPLIGEHTIEILENLLEMKPDQIQMLLDAGSISTCN